MHEQDGSLLMDRPRLGALTSLRFLAAVWVLLFHMGVMGGLRWAPLWFLGLTGRACLAVTFFYILSGFILVYTYGGKKIDLKRFWRARLARLYPVYLLSLILSAPLLAIVAAHPDQVPGTAWYAHHLGLTVALVLTMQQSWVPLAAIAWNAVCWAVSVEVFFYLVFPWLLSRLSRWNLRQVATLAVLGWLAAVTLAGLYVRFSPDGLKITPWNMPDGYTWLHVLKFNPLVRLPEFIAGMACGLWFLKAGHSSHRGTPLILTGGLVLLGILALSSRIPYPLLHTGLAAPAFAAIICGFALRPSWSGFLDTRLCRLLGESSYSLFLLHGMTVGMSIFIGANMATGQLPAPTLLRSAIGVAASVALGLVVFRFVEEPIRKKLTGRK